MKNCCASFQIAGVKQRRVGVKGGERSAGCVHL